MIRALAILALLWASPAQANDVLAFIPSSAGQASGGCVFTTGTTNGSCLAPVVGIQLSQYIGPDANNRLWTFNGRSGSCDSNTPANCLTVSCNNPVTTCSDSGASGIELVWQGSNGPWLETNFQICGSLWRQSQTHAWATGPGALIGGTYFFNNTTDTSYSGLAQLVSNTTDGQTMTISPPPWGTCWAEAGGISTPNLTINLGTTKFADVFTSQGIISFTGSVDGGNAHDIVMNGGEFTTAGIKIRAGAASITLNNTYIHDTHNLDMSAILTGGLTQVTTLNHVLIQGGGAPGSNTGNNHNTYFGGDANSLNDSCFFVTDYISLDPEYLGWNWKDRKCVGYSTPGIITNSIIATTRASSSHAPMNPTCGGNKQFDHDVIENSNFSQNKNFFILYGDDYAAGGGFNGANPNCSNVTPIHTILLDHDIIINDATFGVLSIVNNAITSGSTCTIQNSVIVNNPSAPALVAGSGAGGCSFGTGNRTYASRAAAVAGEGWSGDFIIRNPNNNAVLYTFPCCDWPWLPPHM